MKIVVTGASGNVGTSVLTALGADPGVREIVGLARRPPAGRTEKTTWVPGDVADADLTTLFRGADAVIHLAWLIQPSRDQATLWRANVEGSARVFHAVAAAGVPTLAYASSVGAYSPGPKDREVDEGWPTGGIDSSYYSRQKAEVERHLDRFEKEAPGCRVVRLRPGLIFKRDAATEIRRYFAGPFLPDLLVRHRGLLPLLPLTTGLVFQAVHSLDVGEAFRLAVTTDSAHGAFNVAADPVLDPARLAALVGARPVKVPAKVLRAAAAATWKARLQPSSPGWLDMALMVPLMDTTRARQELGWTPRRTSEEALSELLDGMGHGAGYDTPPLSPDSSGPFRFRELLSGVGARSR
ncbi:MAG TPA: NAD-dependent epimerase/dehydratase family protein [Thermoleophilaceae bacterium]|nr:NAD-dependent epimerase/dehydratase family protein [Thermoleophilaceae bacterium]